MADNTAAIAKIQKLLRSGVRQVGVDGIQATVDTETLKDQLRDLQATDNTAKGKRPVAASIMLGGAM